MTNREEFSVITSTINNQRQTIFKKTLKIRNTISDDKNVHFLPGASFVVR